MVTPPTVSPSGTTALLQVVPSTGPSDPKTADLVHAIRHRVAGTSSAAVSVTGLTAVGIDVSQKLNHALPIYLLLVIGLSFVLLMLMFRSVLVPLKAALGFLLTIGATFGATVAVFQWGWLSATVGLARPGRGGGKETGPRVRRNLILCSFWAARLQKRLDAAWDYTSAGGHWPMKKITQEIASTGGPRGAYSLLVRAEIYTGTWALAARLAYRSTPSGCFSTHPRMNASVGDDRGLVAPVEQKG